jgi:hypothetical protein
MFNSYICSPNLRMWRNGSRTRLRIWRLTAWGFESLHPHHKAEKPSLSAGFYALWMLRQAEKPSLSAGFYALWMLRQVEKSGPSAWFRALWMRPSDSIEQHLCKINGEIQEFIGFQKRKTFGITIDKSGCKHFLFGHYT